MAHRTLGASVFVEVLLAKRRDSHASGGIAPDANLLESAVAGPSVRPVRTSWERSFERGGGRPVPSDARSTPRCQKEGTFTVGNGRPGPSLARILLSCRVHVIPLRLSRVPTVSSVGQGRSPAVKTGSAAQRRRGSFSRGPSAVARSAGTTQRKIAAAVEN